MPQRTIRRFISLGALIAMAGSTLATDANKLAANKLTEAELAEGWISLFDGGSLFGWQPTSEANWSVTDGAIHVSSGEPGLLTTTTEFADYELKVDFRAPETTNSGLFLHTMAHPTDPASDCYEVNIAPPALSPFPTGSVVGRQKRSAGAESDAWRTFHITLVSGRLRVWLDGQEVLDYTDPAPLRRGHIGLQLNEGEVAFRNIKLRPLGTEVIFNGRNLTGWHVTPGHQSEFSVTNEGYLRVVNGSGELESEGRYDDFALQLEVIVGGEHLNSGIFFRSIPGKFWQGYESQIQNGYEDGDRTIPSDYGTGGNGINISATVDRETVKRCYRSIACAIKGRASSVLELLIDSSLRSRRPHDAQYHGSHCTLQAELDRRTLCDGDCPGLP